MFCKTLPSAPASLILYQRISKGFQTRSSFLVPDKKTFMQRRETEKDAFPSYHQQQFERHEVSIWLSAFSIPSLGSWCLVSPHHPFQLTHICSISLHFCILASNFHRMGLHTIFSMLNTGILANGNW